MDSMTLTADQIGRIDQLVDRLKKWQEDDIPHAIKHYNRYTQLIRFVEPQVNIVLMDLSTKMPETVRVVHVKLHELLRKASEVDSLNQVDAGKARIEDANLLKLAQDLVVLLDRIAKDTGDDTPTSNGAVHGLSEVEQDIIGALGDETLTGEKLARETGHPYDFKFRSCLSALRKRGILGNRKPGYFLEPEHEYLLKELNLKPMPADSQRTHTKLPESPEHGS